jgi:hypothetical protein
MPETRLEKQSATPEAAPNVILDPMRGSANMNEALGNASDAVSEKELLEVQACLRVNPNCLAGAKGKVLFGKKESGNFAPSLYGPNGTFDLNRTFTVRGWFTYDVVVRRGPKTDS